MARPCFRHAVPNGLNFQELLWKRLRNLQTKDGSSEMTNPKLRPWIDCKWLEKKKWPLFPQMLDRMHALHLVSILSNTHNPAKKTTTVHCCRLVGTRLEPLWFAALLAWMTFFSFSAVTSAVWVFRVAAVVSSERRRTNIFLDFDPPWNGHPWSNKDMDEDVANASWTPTGFEVFTFFQHFLHIFTSNLHVLPLFCFNNSVVHQTGVILT